MAVTLSAELKFKVKEIKEYILLGRIYPNMNADDALKCSINLMNQLITYIRIPSHWTQYYILADLLIIYNSDCITQLAREVGGLDSSLGQLTQQLESELRNVFKCYSRRSLIMAQDEEKKFNKIVEENRNMSRKLLELCNNSQSNIKDSEDTDNHEKMKRNQMSMRSIRYIEVISLEIVNLYNKLKDKYPAEKNSAANARSSLMPAGKDLHTNSLTNYFSLIPVGKERSMTLTDRMFEVIMYHDAKNPARSPTRKNGQMICVEFYRLGYLHDYLKQTDDGLYDVVSPSNQLFESRLIDFLLSSCIGLLQLHSIGMVHNNINDKSFMVDTHHLIITPCMPAFLRICEFDDATTNADTSNDYKQYKTFCISLIDKCNDLNDVVKSKLYSVIFDSRNMNDLFRSFNEIKIWRKSLYYGLFETSVIPNVLAEIILSYMCGISP